MLHKTTHRQPTKIEFLEIEKPCTWNCPKTFWLWMKGFFMSQSWKKKSEKSQSLISGSNWLKARSCFVAAAASSHAVAGGRKGGKESRMRAVISGLATVELLGFLVARHVLLGLRLNKWGSERGRPRKTEKQINAEPEMSQEKQRCRLQFCTLPFVT